MIKNGKQTTTRHSTTIIQSKVFLTDNNKAILTRTILQYKWLKPQVSAFHLHHFQQTCKHFKIKNIKDAYINSLQSVNIMPILLKKYYKMLEILKEMKKGIVIRSKNNQPIPQIMSLLYLNIRIKYKKIARQKQINLLRQKINPKLIKHHKEGELNQVKSKNKIFFNKNKDKKSSKSKTKRSHEQNSKTKLSNTKIEAIKIIDNHEQSYGLKCYHIKNKLSLHNFNINEKSTQKIRLKPLNDYKQTYYYTNSSRPKHKKTNSNATPQKSIQTSRKVSSKESLYLRSEKHKTESSKEKERLKFSKKHKY